MSMVGRIILGVACAALAACQSQNQNGSEAPSAGISWDDPIQVAAGDAHRGPWRMNESDWRFVDDPTVSINDAGVVAVAWADHARQDILLQVFEPSGERRFAEPVNISRSSSIFSWLPRIEISGGEAGTIHVLWQEIVFSGGSHGGEIFFARSADGGATFDEPLNLSDTIAGAGKGRLSADRWNNGSFDLIRDGEGTLYAAWTEYEGRLWFSRSTDDGRSFDEPILLAGGDAAGELPARGPSLAASADGAVYLAWAVGEDPAADIRLARSADGGQSFGEARLVGPGPGHADAPALALDSGGALHLAYAESDDGPFEAYDILYARRATAGGELAEPRSIAGAHARELNSVHYPTLAVDADDHLYVLWELYPDRRDRPRGLGVTVSDDAKDSFDPPQVVPGSRSQKLGFSGSQQGLLMRKLGVAGTGAMVVVNSTFAPGDASAIWLHRGDRDP